MGDKHMTSEVTHTSCKVPECVSTLLCHQGPFLILESSPLLPLGACISSQPLNITLISMCGTSVHEHVKTKHVKPQLQPNKGVI